MRRTNRFDKLVRRFRDPRNQLEWILDFTQRPDIRNLELAQRTWLDQEIRVFCFVRGDIGVAEEPVTAKQLDDLAQAARFILGALQRGSWNISIDGIEWTAQRDRRTGRIRSTYSGELEVLWPWLVNSLLIEHGHLIRQCASKRCSRFFVKNKRRSYCSNSCAQRERTRRHRTGLTREQRSAIRVRGYIRELQKQHKYGHARKVLIDLRKNRPEVAREAKVRDLIKEFGIQEVEHK